MQKIYQIIGDSLEGLSLNNEQTIELLKDYKADINNMLEVKIEKLKAGELHESERILC